MKKSFFQTVALLCAAVFVCSARAAFSPAGTVVFANLDTVAASIAGLAGKSADPVLKNAVPMALRNQAAVRLFGPMRSGMPGVAVCYVDAQAVAKLMASSRKNEAAFERTKRWTMLYPASISRAAFLQRHPDAKIVDKAGVICVPPGRHSRRTLYAWYSPDGKWATVASAPSLATHTYKAALGALGRPFKPGDLAFVRMSAAGARAVFQTDVCAGGEIVVRLTSAGLELRGTVQNRDVICPTLPASALSFGGVPGDVPLFGVTSLKDDIRSADIFALAGPDVATFVKKSLHFVPGRSSNAYYLPGAPKEKVLKGKQQMASTAPAASLLKPSERLMRILPEAKTHPAASVMFCSPTTVLRIYLPKVAATMGPMDSATLLTGARLLRRVRGDGAGFMGWREKGVDHFLLRISRDELRGTANLWSLLFL